MKEFVLINLKKAEENNNNTISNNRELEFIVFY